MCHYIQSNLRGRSCALSRKLYQRVPETRTNQRECIYLEQKTDSSARSASLAHPERTITRQRSCMSSVSSWPSKYLEIHPLTHDLEMAQMDPMNPHNQVETGITGVTSLRCQRYRDNDELSIFLFERSGLQIAPNGHVYTLQEVASSHPLACRCNPRHINDLGQCCRSGLLVCRTLHGGSCAVCGSFFASPYLTVRHSRVTGQRVLLCTDCAVALDTPPWLRTVRKLVGKVVRRGR